MDRDHVQPMLPKRLQYRGDLGREHGHVAGHGRLRVGADERGPGVQAHARVDDGPHLAHVQVVTANRDFVNGAGLFALRADDLRERRRIESGGG